MRILQSNLKPFDPTDREKLQNLRKEARFGACRQIMYLRKKKESKYLVRS